MSGANCRIFLCAMPSRTTPIIHRNRRMTALKKALPYLRWKTKKEEKFQKNMERYLQAVQNKDERKARRRLKRLADINPRGWHYWLTEDWEIFEQRNMHGKKAFVVERLRRIATEGKLQYPRACKKGATEYRIAYFIVTPKNRWNFGESCSFLPVEDTGSLLKALRRLQHRNVSSPLLP